MEGWLTWIERGAHAARQQRLHPVPAAPRKDDVAALRQRVAEFPSRLGSISGSTSRCWLRTSSRVSGRQSATSSPRSSCAT
jgi:hypothetical protein